MSDTGWTAWRDDRAVEQRAVQGAGLIAKTCDVLDLIGKAPDGLAAAEMQRRTGLSRPTLYRILGALVARGLVRSDPVSQTYALGFRLLEFAQNVWSGSDITAVAASELRRLRDLTGETTYLVVPHQQSVLTMGRFEGPHEHRSMASLGVRKPMHCTSQGKAILSCLPEAKLDGYLERATLEPFTERTITNGALLRAQLAIVRSRGYAIDDEEILAGIRCVGAVILDAGGNAVGAVSVAGPTYRLTSERAEQLGPELVEVTQRIGAQLTASPAGDGLRDGTGTVEVASRMRAFYGAAPVWAEDTQELIWADRLAPALILTGERERSLSLGDRSNAIDALTYADGELSVLIGGTARRLRDGRIQHERTLPGLASLRAIQPDPEGQPWAAIAGRTVGETRIGRLSAEGEVEPLWSIPGDITALAWTPSGERLFTADPGRGVVLALEPKSKRQRVFARLPKASGTPVGLAVDRDQNAWVALRDGWSIARLSGDGEVDHVVPLPVPCPTALAFGGRTLYVTTSSVGISREVLQKAPLSGHLLTADIGALGYIVPAARFAI